MEQDCGRGIRQGTFETWCIHVCVNQDMKHMQRLESTQDSLLRGSQEPLQLLECCLNTVHA